jgi:hypothetical protein
VELFDTPFEGPLKICVLSKATHLGMLGIGVRIVVFLDATSMQTAPFYTFA